MLRRLNGRKNGVCVEFNKDVFKEQSVEQVFTPLFSVVQPYLCSFNLPFWNGIFRCALLASLTPSPLQPQMIEVPPPSHLHDLPLMQNIALVFPLTTQTLYLYRPDHIFMLRKYLRSPFIVTPPCQGDAAPQDVGTVCRVESIVSVGEDGSVLCKVRGDERVHVKAQHRVITEMGSVVGDVEEMKDADGEEGRGGRRLRRSGQGEQRRVAEDDEHPRQDAGALRGQGGAVEGDRQPLRQRALPAHALQLLVGVCCECDEQDVQRAERLWSGEAALVRHAEHRAASGRDQRLFGQNALVCLLQYVKNESSPSD